MSSSVFRFERDLCAVLARDVQTVVRRPNATVIQELAVGTVIPDFLVVDASAVWSIELSHIEARLLADLFEGDARRLSLLGPRLFMREEIVARGVARLERLGLVARIERGLVAGQPFCFPFDSEVIAIEAKLRDWREALAQAISYQAFANRALVAVPRQLLSKRVVGECGAAGVGVIAVDDASSELVRSGRRRVPRGGDWVWVVGRAASLSWPARGRSTTRVGATA